MPYRTTILVPNEFYHIYNRGVAGTPIFFSGKDYLRFLDLIDYYRHLATPLSFSHLLKLSIEGRKRILTELKNRKNLHVEILAFCLMKNHFHILLKQLSANGISTFMKNIQNGYVKYFNTKEERFGPLFQSMFKAVRIENDEQLLHVSRYIHLNPSTDYLVEPENLFDYPWFSLPSYTNKCFHRFPFINSAIIQGLFKDKDSYEEFVLDRVAYQRELGKIKHLTCE